MLAVTSGIAISTSVKTRENLIRIFSIWTISASLSSIISVIIFFLNGHGLSTLLGFNDMTVVEFYEMKFSNSIFFEDPNNLASYLVISIFITIGLISIKHLSNKLIYLMLAIQLLGLLLTLSRSAYIAVGGALLVYLFFYKKKKYNWMPLKVILILVLVFEAKSFYESINSDISMMSRFGLWQVGINMTLSNPFIGVGIGNSSLFFSQYLTSTLLIYNPHFHNLFLTLSSEFGLIGLILFALIFTKHILDLNKIDDKIYVFLVLALIAYLVQSLGVEYFASRHFWIFVPLLIQYKSFLAKGEGK
jgi:O-antigen ligase